jgi:hypothetical protein
VTRGVKQAFIAQHLGAKHMKIAKGGTGMYCPGCKKITTCKAVAAAQVTQRASDYSQRKYYTKHNDIHYFQRGRQCLTCKHEFVSGEVDLGFLRELAQLRDALSEIKANAETYAKESEAASASLAKLSESLETLQALALYKNAGKKTAIRRLALPRKRSAPLPTAKVPKRGA